MCGIAGYFQSKVKESYDLNRVKDLMSHRGPDGSGIYKSKSKKVGLVHTRLAIQDLSEQGRQPMETSNGSSVIVFNGEIYNFKELRENLVTEGYNFKGYSDTEVLLKLYQAKGHDLLNILDGIFAFAIWDEHKKELFIARDALGVKPLFYSQSDNGFSFASEIAALSPLGVSFKHLNFDALKNYITFLWSPGEGTIAQNVKKLNPGHAIIIKNGEIYKSWQWFALPTLRNKPKPPKHLNFVTEVDRLLKKAVFKQMISDVPVGAFLSGGLDSSALVNFARELNPNLECFTIDNIGGPDQGVTNDLPYAKKVASHLNVNLNIVKVNALDISKALEDMVMRLGEPLADLAAINVHLISELAKNKGISVLLSGAGGDDLFSGYRRHTSLKYEQYWDWLPKTTRSFLSKKLASLPQNRSYFRKLSKAFSGAELDHDSRLINYFKWTAPGCVKNLFSDQFQKHLNQSKMQSPLVEFLNQMPSDLSRLDKLLLLEQRFFLSDHNLAYTDRMSMAAGVEVRVPFLDLELMDFVANIPDNLKQRGWNNKWILKKAMEPYLPKEIIYRTKSGFGSPLRRWIDKELVELRDDLLSKTSINNRGIFNSLAIRDLIEKNSKGYCDASYTILSLMCIELWCRNFQSD